MIFLAVTFNIETGRHILSPGELDLLGELEVSLLHLSRPSVSRIHRRS